MTSEQNEALSKGVAAAVWNHSKEVNATIETDLLELKIMEFASGSQVIEGEHEGKRRHAAAVGAAGLVTLPHNVIEGSVQVVPVDAGLTVFAGAQLVEGVDFTVEGNVVAILDTEVNPYVAVTYDSTVNGQQMTIHSTDWPTSFRVHGTCLARNTQTGLDEFAHFTMWNVMPEASLDFTLDVSTPSSFELNLRLLQDAQNRMLSMTFFAADQA